MTGEIGTPQAPKGSGRRIPGRSILAAIALLGAGGAIGATAARMAGPSIEVAPLSPMAISSLKANDGLVTIRGKVGEVYGTSFTLVDGSGRTLVNAGPRANGLVAMGKTVTIQGWSRDGTVLASFLVDSAGTVTPLGRAGHSGYSRHGGPDGPGRDGRAGPGRDGPPPPPPAAAPVPPAAPGNSVASMVWPVQPAGLVPASIVQQSVERQSVTQQSVPLRAARRNNLDVYPFIAS